MLTVPESLGEILPKEFIVALNVSLEDQIPPWMDEVNLFEVLFKQIPCVPNKVADVGAVDSTKILDLETLLQPPVPVTL